MTSKVLCFLAAILVSLFVMPTFSQAAPKLASADLNATAPKSDATDGGARSSVVVQPRIVGGSDTTFEAYPWQVLITAAGFQQHCGGALIHPMIVLTAAHCVTNGSQVFNPLSVDGAFTGRTQTATGGESLQLSDLWWDPAYNPATNDNDVGFISLASPSSRPTIKIAGADEGALWKAGRNAVVTGYGAISEGGPGSPVLKHLTVPILDDSTCAGGNSYGVSFHAVAMLCAGFMAGGQDSCQGDSGGPLQVPVDGGGYRQVGIVSWGTGCARPNLPGVYSRIADATYSARIAEFVRQIETAESFPGTNNGVPVVGSGAKPPGCSAASAAATDAAAAVKKAKKKKTTAQKGVKKAKKAVKKARKKSKGAKKRAAKKLKKAKKKLQAKKKTLNRAKSASASAGNAANAACN
ncbi:MAG: serine protease [Solirubrobacterales bacterium]